MVQLSKNVQLKDGATDQERQNIILQIQQEKANNNNIELLKTLKNKYHSISNKINYINNHDKIKEYKKQKNKIYQTERSDEVHLKKNELLNFLFIQCQLIKL